MPASFLVLTCGRPRRARNSDGVPTCQIGGTGSVLLIQGDQHVKADALCLGDAEPRFPSTHCIIIGGATCWHGARESQCLLRGQDTIEGGCTRARVVWHCTRVLSQDSIERDVEVVGDVAEIVSWVDKIGATAGDSAGT